MFIRAVALVAGVHPTGQFQKHARDVPDAAGAAVPFVAGGAGVQRVGVGEVLGGQVHVAQQRVVERGFDEIGVFGVAMDEVEFVLEEKDAAA